MLAVSVEPAAILLCWKVARPASFKPPPRLVLPCSSTPLTLTLSLNTGTLPNTAPPLAPMNLL